VLNSATGKTEIKHLSAEQVRQGDVTPAVGAQRMGLCSNLSLPWHSSQARPNEPQAGKLQVLVCCLPPLQAKDTSHFKDKESGTDLEVQEKQPLLEWLANNYKKFGCLLEFVTNKWVPDGV
jgi:hypothetical protein